MKVIAREVLYEGKLRAVRDTLEREDGRVFTHETVEHPGAVVILPIAEDNRVIFVEQYRHAMRSQLLELPAGTLEVGEEILSCAHRELAEEIGMAGEEWTALGELYPAPGFCNERQYLFCARGLRPQHGIPDEDENITTVTLTMNEVSEAIMSGRLNDAKSIALLMRARLKGLI